MMGTDPFLWIGIGIADPYHFPDLDHPLVTDPDPIFLTRSLYGSPINDRDHAHYWI